jgi:hypothetical protein
MTNENVKVTVLSMQNGIAHHEFLRRSESAMRYRQFVIDNIHTTSDEIRKPLGTSDAEMQEILDQALPYLRASEIIVWDKDTMGYALGQVTAYEQSVFSHDLGISVAQFWLPFGKCYVRSYEKINRVPMAQLLLPWFESDPSNNGDLSNIGILVYDIASPYTRDANDPSVVTLENSPELLPHSCLEFGKVPKTMMAQEIMTCLGIASSSANYEVLPNASRAKRRRAIRNRG